jgi:hypothetical protein
MIQSTFFSRFHSALWTAFHSYYTAQSTGSRNNYAARSTVSHRIYTARRADLIFYIESCAEFQRVTRLTLYVTKVNKTLDTDAIAWLEKSRLGPKTSL